MQGASRTQRQEKLEGAGDVVQIAQWPEILVGEGEGQSRSVPHGSSRPRLDPFCFSCSRSSCVPHNGMSYP